MHNLAFTNTLLPQNRSGKRGLCETAVFPHADVSTVWFSSQYHNKVWPCSFSSRLCVWFPTFPSTLAWEVAQIISDGFKFELKCFSFRFLFLWKWHSWWNWADWIEKERTRDKNGLNDHCATARIRPSGKWRCWSNAQMKLQRRQRRQSGVSMAGGWVGGGWVSARGRWVNVRAGESYSASLPSRQSRYELQVTEALTRMVAVVRRWWAGRKEAALGPHVVRKRLDIVTEFERQISHLESHWLSLKLHLTAGGASMCRKKMEKCPNPQVGCSCSEHCYTQILSTAAAK